MPGKCFAAGLLCLAFIAPLSWAQAGSRTFDIGAGKAPIVDALANGKGLVDFQFVGDDQIAVTATDRYIWPTEDHGAGDIHFAVYFFNAETGQENPQQMLQFTLGRYRPALRGLPSGGFLISLGGKVLSYDAHHELQGEATAADLCGIHEGWAETPIDTSLYVASDEMAILNVMTNRPGQANASEPVTPWPKPHVKDVYYCWFAINGMRSVAGVKADLYAPRLSARDSKIQLESFPDTVAVTPNGQKTKVAIPEQCPRPRQFVELRNVYLLHFIDAGIVPCTNKVLARIDGSEVSLLSIQAKGLYPFIVADAWKAPVILLNNGKVNVRLFGGFKSSDELELFNYQTRKSFRIEKSHSKLPGPIYLSGQSKIILSPSGRRVGVTRGAAITVYEIPQQFLASISR